MSSQGRLSAGRTEAYLAFIAVLFAAIFIIDLYEAWTAGGYRWEQGDWLIHWLSGPVRRGIIGTGLIFASDTFSVDLFALTIVVQVVLSVALAAVLYLVGRAGMTASHQIVAFLLPPFYPMMMVSFYGGQIFKDMLAIIALGLFTLAVLRPAVARRSQILGVIVLSVGVFAHEAMVFFFPVAAYLILLSGRSRFHLSLIGLLGAATLAAFLFSVVFARGDPEAICAELTTRGVDTNLCGGPIDWLGATVERALTETWEEATGDKLIAYFVVWLFSVVVLAYLMGQSFVRGLTLGVLTLLPFVPLFIIAFAFGRWFSFGYSSLVFVMLAQGNLQRLPGQIWVAAGALAVSLIVTYDSTGGVYLSGLMNRLQDFLM